ncbi:MAG: glycoside hydrolase family 95-like protein [Chitinophagaceae bacterium]
MQSHANEISLLPALPKEWPSGRITGLRGRGGYAIDLRWKNNTLVEAALYSSFNRVCTLRTKVPVQITLDGKSIVARKLDTNLYVFKAVAGKCFMVIRG